MKKKLTNLVCLAGTALLFRGLCHRTPDPKTWKSFLALLKASSGLVWITDLALPLRKRKIPAT